MSQSGAKLPLARTDSDFIFHELTRSICTVCKRVIDAQVILRDNKVYMRKRCPEHDWFEGLVSSDAQMYVASVAFNKPGTMPLQFGTEVKDGCPLDCGICPEHKQHTCLALIEVNTGCNLNCPVCFADAGDGFSLTFGRGRADVGPPRRAGGGAGGGPVQWRRAHHSSSNPGYGAGGQGPGHPPT